MESTKALAARMREIYAALRARQLERAEGVPVSELGEDSLTRAALKGLSTEARHIEIVDGVANLTGTGFNEAFRIERGMDTNDAPAVEQTTLFKK